MHSFKARMTTGRQTNFTNSADFLQSGTEVLVRSLIF